MIFILLMVFAIVAIVIALVIGMRGHSVEMKATSIPMVESDPVTEKEVNTSGPIVEPDPVTEAELKNIHIGIEAMKNEYERLLSARYRKDPSLKDPTAIDLDEVRLAELTKILFPDSNK